MNPNEIKNLFKLGKLEKHQYIHQMHQIHRVLFQYDELLKETNISKIEIVDGMVLMTARDTGVTLVCDPSDERVAPIEILNFGEYEKNDSDMMVRLLESSKTMLDVGANYGWYSLNLSKKISGLQIHAFEPIPKTFDYLKRNVELNKLNNITIHNFGFSTQEENKTFYFYPEGSGNASLANLSERADVQTINCKLKRLDDFVEETKLSVDFIKCDVEGAELFVFQGGQKTLRDQKPIVFTEMLRKWAAKFDYHPNEIISLFKELGYRCFTSQNGSLSAFSMMDEATIETNFFFIHPARNKTLIDKFSIA